MADYFQIVYINTHDGNDDNDLPDAVERIRDWSWNQSAYVRWSYTQHADLAALANANLAILDWSSRNSNLAEKVCGEIRARQATLPIFVLRSDPGRAPNRDLFLRGDKQALLLSDKDTASSERIASTFAKLELQLSSLVIELHPDHRDWATNTLIEWVGRERLALIIQKHFPDAKDAYLTSVGGGWSDARLCRLFVDDEPGEYFLKFFPDREIYTTELLQHAAAQEWLGKATVQLRLIPNLGANIAEQNEAFPDVYPPRFPICYESGSTRDRPRETLRTLYRDHSDDFIEGAFTRLIEILAGGQNITERMEPPWSDSGRTGFMFTSQTKVNILETIQDLSMYGPTIYGDTKWKSVQDLIQRFLYQSLPSKLYQPSGVMIGRTHGDPNPRNCLINSSNKDDLLLIDCGGYQEDGRLVSDLALIERDIKLLLLGIEQNAGGFLDLDMSKLADWCHSEGDAVSRRLNYSTSFAPALSETVKRAYRLVGLIRERARQLTTDNDTEGRHYFGALLFWTLDALKYPAIRPTKRLFALHSAAEIISVLR